MSTLHVNARQIRTDKYNSLLMMSLLLPDARSRGTRAAVHRSVAEMEGEEQGWVTIPRSFPASQKSPFFLIRCLMLIVNLLLYSTLLRKLVVRVTACFSVKGMEFGVPPLPPAILLTPFDCPHHLTILPFCYVLSTYLFAFWGKFFLLFLTLSFALVLLRRLILFLVFISSVFTTILKFKAVPCGLDIQELWVFFFFFNLH